MTGRGHPADLEALERDADKIGRRYLAARVSIAQLQRDYHIGYWALMEILGRYATPEQRAKVRIRRLRAHGRRHGFQKGHVPWTKGQKGVHFSPATEFTPGCMRGAVRTWRPIGTITTRHDKIAKRLRGRSRKPGVNRWQGRARKWIKVGDYGPPAARWIPLAQYVWTVKRGPIPAGKFVAHLDGDTFNDEIENLVLVDHAEAIALTRARNPGMEERRRKASAKALTKFHQVRRALREHRQRNGGTITRWQCPGCGGHVDRRRQPDHCTKCGGHALENIQIRSPEAADA